VDETEAVVVDETEAVAVDETRGNAVGGTEAVAVDEQRQRFWLFTGHGDDGLGVGGGRSLERFRREAKAGRGLSERERRPATPFPRDGELNARAKPSRFNRQPIAKRCRAQARSYARQERDVFSGDAGAMFLREAADAGAQDA
jgi:hypothetical protein